MAEMCIRDRRGNAWLVLGNGKAIQRGEMKNALILQRIFDKQQFYD